MSIATWEFESPPLHLFSAEIAQLVEHNLAKVGVAGPSPVFRSIIETFDYKKIKQMFFFEINCFIKVSLVVLLYVTVALNF